MFRGKVLGWMAETLIRMPGAPGKCTLSSVINDAFAKKMQNAENSKMDR